MKEKYGQYMTPEIITDFMVSLIHKNPDCKVLEPASGKGAFIKSLTKKGFNNITAFEIDSHMIGTQKNIRHESFVSAVLDKDFDVVIGNPPYIRWKNLEEELKKELYKNHLFNTYLNALNDYSAIFILKAIEHLKENGELIFITPDYWMDTTHSSNLRNFLLDNGYITDLYIFKEARIFKNATVSTMVFRFIKGKNIENQKIRVHKYMKQREVTQDIINALLEKAEHEDVYNFSIEQFSKDTEWLIAQDSEVAQLEKYEQSCTNINIENDSKMNTLEDFCEIGNGMVSGLDKAFQLEKISGLNENETNNLLKVIKAKDLVPYTYEAITHYIFITDETKEDFEEKYPHFKSHLKPFKESLLKRYSYNRNIPYWEWVFLRNYNLFKENTNKIFVPCKERISNKDYHRFAIVKGSIFPTQDVTAIIAKNDTKESLEYICALLNSKQVFNWIKHKGIIKGNIVEFSRAPLAKIPFRAINFNDSREVEIHDNITQLVSQYCIEKQEEYLVLIQNELNKLI